MYSSLPSRSAFQLAYFENRKRLSAGMLYINVRLLAFLFRDWSSRDTDRKARKMLRAIAISDSQS